MVNSVEQVQVRGGDGLTGDGAHRFIGRPAKRGDAPERLTGQTRYTADLALPGALQARFVRSPYASARVVGVDSAEALALPGVVAVLTARDLPIADWDWAVAERKLLLAVDRVLHAGQPVAVVLGETERAAEDGAAAVNVEYEPMPAAVDPVAALAPDAPVVQQSHERDEAELAAHGAAPSQADEEDSPQAPNVASHTRQHRGDVEQGFREADVVVERSFSTSWVHQGYMEPMSCAATIDPLGHLQVFASTQAMFEARARVARALGLPEHQVTIQPMPVGGGFGAKFAFLEVLVAALAMAVRRPVQLTYTRMDEFVTACPAPETRMRVKVGARRDGTLTALEGEVLFDSGAWSGSPVGLAGLMLASTYRWPSFLVTGQEVLTNKAGTGAYRAPGVPQAMFALESAMDDLARELKMDPLELRRKNAARTGDPTAAGAPWPKIGFEDVLDRAEPIYRAERAAAGPDEGVGVAVGCWMGGVEPAAAVCRLDGDGTLQITVGAVDLSGTHTSFQIIAAEVFGLESPDEVRVTLADSDAAPYAGASGGSKITYTVGEAVRRAAAEARQQVLYVAADQLEASMDDLEIAGGEVRVRGVPDRSISLRHIAEITTAFGGRYEPIFGRGRMATTERGPAFAIHVARVHVDRETGRVTPIRHVAIQDVGKAINPATVAEQMMGGAVQSVGWGLYERLAFDEDGAPLTASFLDYTLPKATQVPEVEAVIVEVPSTSGPFGARPVGEPPVTPGAAAIANAVRDAVGVRVGDLPLTSERVFAALEAA